jgi:hypothetical protein
MTKQSLRTSAKRPVWLSKTVLLTVAVAFEVFRMFSITVRADEPAPIHTYRTATAHEIVNLVAVSQAKLRPLPAWERCG